MPFGGGTRRCIGASFARYEAAVILATVMREFRLDFHASRPKEKCTVGALRAESPDVDMTPIRQGIGGTAASDDEGRIVTGGDIMRQLAGAFVERS